MEHRNTAEMALMGFRTDSDRVQRINEHLMQYLNGIEEPIVSLAQHRFMLNRIREIAEDQRARLGIAFLMNYLREFKLY